MFQFVFDRVKNIEGKGENTGYQHFLKRLVRLPEITRKYWLPAFSPFLMSSKVVFLRVIKT